MEEVISSTEGLESGANTPKQKRRKINRQKLQDNVWGWLFCLPLIVGTVWFIYVAFGMSLLISFTNYGPNSGSLSEYLSDFSSHIHPEGAFYWYERAFTQTTATDYPMNELFAYLFNTVFYMLGIPIGLGLSLFFAVCMTRDIQGGNLFRVLYYLPVVASAVSVIYTFKILFESTGVVNQLLGLGEFNWLVADGTNPATWNRLFNTTKEGAFMNDPYWCQGIFQKLIVIVMSIWKGLGGTIILFVAGLSGVNPSTKEAGQIDGASSFQIFRKIVLPELYPVIFYNVVTTVIGGMQIYMEPELLFGASYLTSGFVSLIWGYGLNFMNGGRQSAGAAYGMILAVIIFLLTTFQFWLDSRNKRRA